MSNDEKRHRAQSNNPLGQRIYEGEATDINTSDAFKKLMQSKGGVALALASREIRTGPFIWTRVGLQVDGEITRQSWEETGRVLQRVEASLQWLLGDWMLAAKELGYGDREQFAESIGLSIKTLYDYTYVANNVEFSVRTEILSFGHHKIVASMSAEKQRYWLDLAAQGEDGKCWSIARLRNEITGDDDDTQPNPPWLKPIAKLRDTYSPERWQKLPRPIRRQVYNELRGIVQNMAQEFEDEDD